MTIHGLFFYIIAAVIVAATAVAITRRNLVHAVVYLIVSYFGTAMLFYFFGAPLLAAFEVIIYAGAIMVLFLFVVMMVKVDSPGEVLFPVSQWIPAAIFGAVYLVIGFLMVFETDGADAKLSMLTASPRDFALYVLEKHWFSIEVISLLLLLALVGALHLGKSRIKHRTGDEI